MSELFITGGLLKSRKITFTADENLRPTLSKTREAIFNILNGMFDFEHATFLDAFAGSGIISFEAFSRGFSELVCIDKNKHAFSQIKSNINKLSVEITPIYGDTLKSIVKLAQNDKKFDVIFVDPPYLNGLYMPVLQTILMYGALSPHGVVILEHLENMQFEIDGYEIIKRKKYSDKAITLLKHTV